MKRSKLAVFALSVAACLSLPGNVPTGKVTVTLDFKYDGGGMSKGGTMTLLANGKKIGEGRVEKTAGVKYSLYEGQDVGEDSGSPVDFSYTLPFKFSGKLDKVTVELKEQSAVAELRKTDAAPADKNEKTQ